MDTVENINWKLMLFWLGVSAVLGTWTTTLYWTLVSLGYVESPWMR